MKTLVNLLSAVALSSSVSSFGAEASPAAATVDALFAAALAADGQAYARLTELVSQFPGRFPGHPHLTGAEQWAAAQFGALGADRVYRQETTAASWSRGTTCEVSLTGQSGPVALAALAIGGSVGTPEGGLTAGVVEVRSAEALEALDPARAKGRILFCNVAMDPTLPDVLTAYQETSDIRRKSAGVAGKLGARAVLIRSLTTRRDDTPHTGSMTYPPGDERVPAIALSTLACETLAAALAADPALQVHVTLDCEPLPPAPVANVVAELTGTAFPDQIILVGAHIDSWDISPGAHDDGAGVAQVMETLRLFRELKLKPRHTIRAVLFTNEEFGKAGAIRYVAAMREAGEKHIVAIESDHGGFAPLGYNLSHLHSDAPARAARWRPLLEKHGLYRFERGEGGPDLRLFYPLGVPVAGLIVDSNRYFDLHHTPNDGLDQVHPRELALGAGALASFVWLVDQEGW